MKKKGFSNRHFFELLYLLVKKDFKVRYKNSLLGYLWALANPFAFALVYYIAFKVVMRIQVPNYALFLLVGLFPWAWFANSLVHATGSYRNNASLIKRANMPRAVLPLGSVAQEMLHFCFAIPVLVFFIKFSGAAFYLSWLWQVPLLILTQFALIYPTGILLALANVYAHDVEYLVGIGLSMLFFLTPVVYATSMVPDPYRGWFEMNPLAALIGNWRSVLLFGRFDAPSFFYCLVVAAFLAGISIYIFKHASAKLGELL